MDCTRRRFLLLLAVGLGVAALPACAREDGRPAGASGTETVQRTLFCFDTVCSIGGAMDRSVLDEAAERCGFFEQRLSATIETSDVARINAAGGAPVQVAPETADLINRSLRYSRESDGLFDITIGAVSSLWDFKEGVVPDAADIERALPHVNYRNVTADADTVTLADPLARIDLGGIAKGFIADDLVGLLASRGVQSAFVNLGGNVKVLGAKEDGTPWSIGVRDARRGSGSVVASIESTGGSLVTSGLYERRFEREGRAYWHILDPRTGYPVESDLVSASVYSQDSLDGDGFTKPLFMLGRDRALAFLEEREGLQGLLIGADGSISTTGGSGFEVR